MNCRQKIYLTLVIFVVAVIALLLFLICPLDNKIKTLSSELAEKSNIVSSYKEKGGDYLTWLHEEYIRLETQISKINKSFVNSEKAIDFILAIERTAVLTNNYQDIKEIRLVEEEGNILFFQISLWGNFPDLIKFLAQIENMDCFVESDSLQITKIGERDLRGLADKGIMVSAGDIKSTINIKVYTK